MECSCIECRKMFSHMGIHTHYDRMHSIEEVRTKYSSGYNGSYEILSDRAKLKKQSEIEQYNLNPKICIVCSNIILYEHKHSNYCCASCGAKHGNKTRKESGWILSDEAKNKIRLSLEEHRKIYGVGGRPSLPMKIFTCLNCGNSFERKRTAKYCSKQCCGNHKQQEADKTRTPFKNYARRCSFKFSLNNYPDKFNFSLIEEFGWYSATNHGNNLSGISRDHMVSVRYGFDNGIDPKIISHPANCNLLQHNKNSSKHSKCSITLSELKQRIELWDADRFKSDVLYQI